MQNLQAIAWIACYNPAGIHGSFSFVSVDCCLEEYCDRPIAQPDAFYRIRLPVCVCVCVFYWMCAFYSSDARMFLYVIMIM